MPPVTAKARAQVRLSATTSLDPAAALSIVKQATSAVKGGGKSLLTTGVVNIGATIHIEAESPDRLGLSINSGKRIVELCTFSAVVGEDDGVTRLRVGGLETYRTSQSKLFGFIPSGPKMIHGYDPYRRFLDAVRAGVLAQDPAATITIAEPTATPTTARS